MIGGFLYGFVLPLFYGSIVRLKNSTSTDAIVGMTCSLPIEYLRLAMLNQHDIERRLFLPNALVDAEVISRVILDGWH